ncbi:sialate O-acetylesterase [Rhodoblastus acidophilus]|uniref:sialate O-acetylesterase n=1 Tax=Rhodoblastus acidophilus TaxID=1074 RepID=UPI00222453D7|nr:sialate O-acetylesterase [Rhodoblastus acidophilus]
MWKTLLSILAIGAIYTSGALSKKYELFPWPQLSALKERFAPSAPHDSRYRFDANGLLVADESKTAIACPEQTGRTAVLLALGQSNAANYGGQRFQSQHGDNVVNFFGGGCFVAASPLLGSTGAKGEYWTRLGDLLIASGRYDRVVIAPLAFSGSLVARWAPGGDIAPLLADLAGRLKARGYRVTAVLWDQGEADFVAGTRAETYRDKFLAMVDTLRANGVDAPVHVAVASKCLEPSNGGFKFHVADNEIVRAQQALALIHAPGVSTDALLDPVDRYDDCHMAGSGLEKTAQAWAQILLDSAKPARRAESR